MAEPQILTTLDDWIDDLTVRFLLNLPASELSSVPRLCFQVEEAQWFYEDFVRPAVAASGAPPLPNLHLRQFCLLLFQHCPLLSGFTDAQHIAAYEEFLAYKVRVPVRGAILLDHDMEKVVLVRGWKKGASWSFPRGKINKDEKDLDCAIREVYEETGYDVREAGLVPDDEKEVKYIDITMREQHMRLFVFRDVPEDTHFEPKTRKEIGKIDWYSIKDLPGFKKQKTQQHGQQGGGATHANKFYMVAPFLGPLKKWVHQQRKRDEARMKVEAVSNGYSAAQTGTEDEGEVEEEQTLERDTGGVDASSEELKRLLSIGGFAAVPASSALEPAKPDVHSGNLLAMLQGGHKPTNGNQVPRTPFEQISAFPQEPETPQPDHLRHPSLAQQRQQPPPPQFPLSPPRLQQQQEQQRIRSLPTPSVFGPGPAGFPLNQQHPAGFPGVVPTHIQQRQQFPQRQSMHSPMPGMPFNHPNGFGTLSNGQRQPMAPMQTPHMPPPPLQQQQPAFQQRPPNNAYMAQGPQGAIGSGPAVPNASQLPPPRLNAQSMKLLDTFKNGSNAKSAASTTGPAAAGQRQERPTSTHQAALLDLFRKPSTSQSHAIQPAPGAEHVDEPVSPTLTDTTVKPSKPLDRRPTLNEITRTLPAKTKAKSPIAHEMPAQIPMAQPPTRPQPQPVWEKPAEQRSQSRQLWDPNNSTQTMPLKSDGQLRAQQPSLGHVKPKSPRPKPATTVLGSPSRKDGTAKSNQNGKHTPPPFTILARPGSAKGPMSPAAPPSPLRNEGTKPAFQPQVLKRPKAHESASPAASIPEMEQKRPADKKDQLLALFGKAPISTPTPQSRPDAQTVPPSQNDQSHPSAVDERKNSLLNLFNTPPSTQPTPTPMAPPPAPKIEPERRPPSKNTSAAPGNRQQQQQNLLLDLFANKTSGTPITSPGTPISPFTLGTPAQQQKSGLPSGTPAGASGEQRSRLNSVTSSSSPTTTPVEAKEFLMGYLNGVVKSEGHRGGGRR